MNKDALYATTLSKGVVLYLSYRPPYHWQNILKFYRDHLIEPVEQVTETYYARFCTLNQSLCHVKVENEAAKNRLKLTIRTAYEEGLDEITNTIRRMFDIDINPMPIQEKLSAQPPFDYLCATHAGLRLAGGWNAFETGIFVILGQLVSTTQARALVKQLVKECGTKISIDSLPNSEEAYLFPSPEAIYQSELNEVKTTLIRKNTLRAFAKFALESHLDRLKVLSFEEIRKKLLQISGIGAWTADIISIRAFGNTDVFPSSDLILKRAMSLFPDLEYHTLSPWRSYAAFLMWREYANQLSKTKKNETTL